MKTRINQFIPLVIALIINLGFIFQCLIFLGCTQEKNKAGSNDQVYKSDSTLENQIIQNVSKNIILKTYVDLAKSTQKLNQLVSDLSLNPTQNKLDLAAKQWRLCRSYWEMTESFLFGPVYSLNIDSLIDTWPLNISDLNAILNRSNPITIDVLRSLGTNLKGFHTIEYLLFGSGINTNYKKIENMTSRELEYLTAATGALAEDTMTLSKAWEFNYDPDNLNSPPYFNIISQPGVNNIFYNSKFSVIQQFLQGMITIADEVSHGKIADPLGPSIEEANAAAEESPFSWNSVEDFSFNIISLQMIYLGQNPDGSGNGEGLKKLIALKDPELSLKIERKITESINKIQAIDDQGMSFGQAIFNLEGRKKVIEAQIAVDELFILLNENARRTLLE